MKKQGEHYKKTEKSNEIVMICAALFALFFPVGCGIIKPTKPKGMMMMMREVRLRWSVNGMRQGDLLASPGDEKELMLGCLCAAGRLRRAEQLTDFVRSADGFACTVEDAEEAPPLARRPQNAPFAFLQARMRTIDRPAGAHTAALLCGDGRLLIRCDISRHHALHRVIGAALLRGIDLQDCAVSVSARVTLSLAEAAIRAGLAALQTDKLISDAADEAAKRAGMLLAGKAERGEPCG